MRDATGGALLINIILTFIVIFIALLSSSINYSKAFKVKDRIIDIIEEERAYNDDAKAKIHSYLKDVGYIISTQQTCSCGSDRKCTNLTPTARENSGYRYCVYKYTDANQVYYKVVAYMYFDMPIVSDVLKIPVYGETRSF